MERKQLLVECPCGVVLQETGEDALITAVQAHATEVHDMELRPEQVLDMARPL